MFIENTEQAGRGSEIQNASCIGMGYIILQYNKHLWLDIARQKKS